MEELQRRPGRPPKYVEAEAEPVRQRPVRRPFGAMQQKLARQARPGFRGYWFKDIPGRIQSALEAGYEHIKDRDGKNTVAITGTNPDGSAEHCYYMEIPEEWFKEDMAAQQKERDEKMAAIKQGEANRQDGDGRYIPKQGITIKDGR